MNLDWKLFTEQKHSESTDLHQGESGPGLEQMTSKI